MISFSASKAELAAGLAWAATGLPRRAPLPILAGIRVQASAGEITVAAFDYDVTASARVAAEVTAAGTVLVAGRDLVNAVKGLPGSKTARVQCQAAGAVLLLTCDGAQASAELLDLAEYPTLPAMPAETAVIDSATFGTLARRILPAAGADDTLPVLTCVRVVLADGTVTMSATDRYRLATGEASATITGSLPAATPAPAPRGKGKGKRSPATPAAGEPGAVNIPARPLAAFLKIAAKAGKITLHYAEPAADDTMPAMAGLSDGTREMIVRTNPADFPTVTRLIPAADALNGSADVDAAALADAVKRAGKACDRVPTVFLRFTRDSVTVTAYRDDTLASSQTLPAAVTPAMIDGRKIIGWTAAYNPAYLADAVTSAGETVRLAWQGSTGKPLFVTRAGEPADAFRALVMPVRATPPAPAATPAPPSPDGEPAPVPAAA